MTDFCPHCGRRIANEHMPPGLRRVPDNTQTVRRFAMDDGGAAVSGPIFHEFRRPARPPNVAADVATPAAQAGITAIAAAFVTAALVPILSISWAAVPTAAGVAFAAAWLLLLRAGRDGLFEVERHERAAEPSPIAAEPARPATRLSVSLEGGRVQHERDLPIEPDELLRLARALAGGAHTFSERELTSAGLITGRAQYEAMRDQFLAAGWARWKAADRRQGIELTGPGRAALAALADGRVTVEDVARSAA